jgi:uncharacterized protein (TIGR03437 family)
MRVVRLAFFLWLGFIWQAAAQSWDTSGNGLLQGTCYFREVIYVIADNSGNLGRALSVYGNIAFDGTGGYSITGTVMDSDSGSPQSFNTSGTYSISASGYGFLSSPVSTGDSIYGLVSQGIFIGSSTDSGFNDLFIAAPVGSSAATNASFKGPYWIAELDYPSGSPLDVRASLFQLNPDGLGNLGTVSVSGYIGGAGTTVVRQTIQGVRYAFSNGAANVTFGGSLTTQNLIAGNRYLYISPDGNFVFGGSPTGWDMFVGVRAASSATFGGIYYQAGVEEDESQLANGFATLQTFYGSLKANSGLILNHRRIQSVFNNSAYDFTYQDSYSLNPDGTYDDPSGFQHYIFGAGGAIRIGFGKNPYLGINVAFQSPSFSGSGVFIYPNGIVNAASSALFTVGIAPGELISIYGTNLASGSAVDATFPTTLAGVQVTVNGIAAHIYVVSPTQISAIVPYAATGPILQFQVINQDVSSNAVTMFSSLTSPGVFTLPPGGIGYAAALHPDFSIVTPSSPAQIGETVAVFVTGLGLVNPAIADGAPGPTDQLSSATSTISAFVHGQAATVHYAGLAPQLIGLYQINVEVPSGVSAGDVYVDISGPDSYTSQALLTVAGGATTAVPGTSTSVKLDRPRSALTRPVGSRLPVARQRSSREVRSR